MLIENKFIYLSLPRCASTSFFISCIRRGFTYSHANSISDKVLKLDFHNLSNMDLVYQINHFHETLDSLLQKFGHNYDIISIKRNKYERFVSYFNHCIGELKRNNNNELADKLLELETDDIFFYRTEDLLNRETKISAILNFLTKIGYHKYNKTLESLLLPMITPLSVYHNNNPKIIWFDFNKLYELENWVSEKTQKHFKLESFGSSYEYRSKISVDDNFIKKYNKIYNYYEDYKKQKSII